VPDAVVGRTVFPLPDAVDDAAGALVEPVAVAVHAVSVAGAGRDDVVLVSGAGTIGLTVTALLARAGVGTLAVAEPSALRRAAAAELGADIVIDPAAEDPVKALRAITGPGAYGLGARVDVAVECSGAGAALATALKAARSGGTLVLAGIYGGEIGVRVDRIVEKELRVRGTVAYADEFPEAIALLASGTLDAARLVSHAFELGDVGEAFRVQADASRSLKVQVRP
jgi:2-desacetyl-2-hydroxyethyl bacteriochlorophyllide A dehydrogenase